MISPTIEIIGPPGVGKSTVYRALCKRWKSTSNWVYQERLLTAGPYSTIESIENFVKRSLRIKTAKVVPVDFGLRYIENNKSFASLCWQILSEKEVPSSLSMGQCFRAAHFMFLDFCRYQAIIEKQSNKPCIISEGFLQKSFLVLDSKEAISDMADKYLSVMPIPAGIIYINSTDKNLILHRLKNRNKVIASHKDKNEQDLLENIEKWQYLFSVMLDALSTRQVSILYLKAENPIEVNVKLIEDSLQSLSFNTIAQESMPVMN